MIAIADLLKGRLACYRTEHQKESDPDEDVYCVVYAGATVLFGLGLRRRAWICRGVFPSL